MKPLHDDLMKLVGGGYDVEDLTRKNMPSLKIGDASISMNR